MDGCDQGRRYLAPPGQYGAHRRTGTRRRVAVRLRPAWAGRHGKTQEDNLTTIHRRSFVERR